jgi:MSHA biogenesis protein MshL
MIKRIILLAIMTFILGCAEIEPQPFEPSSAHISVDESNESAAVMDSNIPEIVEQVPVLPEPSPVEPPERYTVVVNEVPVKELLFALARDAKVNVDIHPEIEGVVTINAVEQTLPQILKRISNQVDMRYKQDGNNLVISRDTPYLRTYKIDYVNLSRDTTSTSTVSTQIASTSGGGSSSSSGSGSSGGNTSTTDVNTESNHHFWSRLVSNISAILGEEISASSGSDILVTETVIPNPESGVLTVRATAAQHEQIQSFIDQVLVSAKRQVMIQTTIVEVTLNERYQAGIDWTALSTGVFNIASTTSGSLPTFIAGAVSSSLSISTDNKTNNPQGTNPVNEDNITATITLLDQFGDTKILSSPQMMVLNNQTALLKVVENLVYFDVDAEVVPATVAGGTATTTVDTTALTVPVGIVMSVTPQIDSNGEITLVVRPTISRFVKNVTDPNPNAQFTAGGTTVTNSVPQIAVREMESVLRMTDGQIGVLGGLMSDETRDDNTGLPGIKDKGFLGNLFKRSQAEYTKTELVIFIKPIIIDNPDVDSDLNEYKNYISKGYLPENKVQPEGEDSL